ncbi:hypothetical protein LXL04_003049 [Taraxacum kok-saghyz]
MRRFANTSSNLVEVANSDDENQNNVDNQNIMIDPPINVINPEINNENNPEINNENNLEINNENIDEDLNMNIDANEEVSDTKEEIDENQLNIVVQNIQATSENQNEEDDDESIGKNQKLVINIRKRRQCQILYFQKDRLDKRKS